MMVSCSGLGVEPVLRVKSNWRWCFIGQSEGEREGTEAICKTIARLDRLSLHKLHKEESVGTKEISVNFHTPKKFYQVPLYLGVRRVEPSQGSGTKFSVGRAGVYQVTS